MPPLAAVSYHACANPARPTKRGHHCRWPRCTLSIRTLPSAAWLPASQLITSAHSYNNAQWLECGAGGGRLSQGGLADVGAATAAGAHSGPAWARWNWVVQLQLRLAGGPILLLHLHHHGMPTLLLGGNMPQPQGGDVSGAGQRQSCCAGCPDPALHLPVPAHQQQLQPELLSVPPCCAPPSRLPCAVVSVCISPGLSTPCAHCVHTQYITATMV